MRVSRCIRVSQEARQIGQKSRLAFSNRVRSDDDREVSGVLHSTAVRA